MVSTKGERADNAELNSKRMPPSLPFQQVDALILPAMKQLIEQQRKFPTISATAYAIQAMRPRFKVSPAHLGALLAYREGARPSEAFERITARNGIYEATVMDKKLYTHYPGSITGMRYRITETDVSTLSSTELLGMIANITDELKRRQE